MNEFHRLGAIAACAVAEISEGTPPVGIHGERARADIEYMLLSAKAYQREMVRSEDPAALAFRRHMFGGWAVVPFERVGEVVVLLLAGLREFVGETSVAINVQPMPHSEIRQLWPEVGSGER